MNENDFIDKFIGWNEALLEYFFPQNSDSDEVLITIDNNTLDGIGAEKGLGNHDDFIANVLLSREQRRRLYDYLKNLIGFRPNRDRYLLESGSIMEFASFLAEDRCHQANQNVNLSDKKFFFCYIVLVVYFAGQGRGELCPDPGQEISNQLIARLNGENGNYRPLEDIFYALAKKEPRFKARYINMQRNQRFVGLIRYQYYFNRRQIEELYRGLYLADFDDDIEYENKLQRLVDYVNDSWRNILRSSRGNTSLAGHIERLINSFDRDAYSETHQNIASKTIGKFALCLDPVECKLQLLTNVSNPSFSGICGKKTQSKLTLSRNSEDKYDREYYTTPIEIDGKPEASMKKYAISSENTVIYSVELGNVVFFKYVSVNKYLQTRELPLNSICRIFVAVKNDRDQEWTDWAEKHVREYKRIDNTTDNVRTIIDNLIGEYWNLYDTSFYDEQYYRTPNNTNNSTNTIQRKGGIQQLNKNNVYLVNALPYFDFQEKISTNDLFIFINVDDYQLDEGEGFHKYILGSKLIIDIVKDFDYTNGAKRVDVNIEYKDFQLPDEETSFYICGQNVKYSIDSLLKYDQWGTVASDADVPYICGNDVYGVQASVIGNATTIGSLDEIKDEHIDRMYLVNIIAALCFMSSDSVITNSKLNKCIKYAITRFGDELDYEDCLKSIRYLLMESGYICPKYDRIVSYQAIPPTFVKVSYARVGNKMYMLQGAYTQKFIRDLKYYCKGTEKRLYVRNTNIGFGRNIQRLLPPIVFVDCSINLDGFKEQYHHQFEIINDDLDKKMISMIPELANVENTLESVNIGIRLRNAEETSFPRVRVDNTRDFRRSYYLENSENVFFKTSLPDANSWLTLYSKWKKNESLILHCNYDNNVKLYLSSSYRMPNLIKRIMYHLNIGFPTHERIFMLDNEDDKNRFYKTMLSYNLENRAGDYLSLLDKRLYGGVSSLYCMINRSIPNRRIRIYKKKELFSSDPYCFFALDQKEGDRTLVLSYDNKVAVRKSGNYHVVNESLNTIVSKVMHSKNSVEDIDFDFTTEILSMPDKSNYTEDNREITIVQKQI